MKGKQSITMITRTGGYKTYQNITDQNSSRSGQSRSLRHIPHKPPDLAWYFKFLQMYNSPVNELARIYKYLQS